MEEELRGSDHARLRSVINFIFDCLAKRQDSEKRPEGLSERDIGALLEPDSPSKGRSRYRSLIGKAKKKTTGEIVELLVPLRQQMALEYYLKDQEKLPNWLISSEQIYVVLHKLTALTPEEKKSLGLLCDDTELLLQQIVFNLYVYQQPWNYDKLLSLYRRSVELDASSEASMIRSGDENRTQHPTEEWIKSAIGDYERSQFGYEVQEDKAGEEAKLSFSYLKDLEGFTINGNSPAERLNVFSKVMREIDRILFKSGIQQLNLQNLNSTNKYKNKYLPHKFLRRLTQSVFENLVITRQFPIFLQDISIETCGPFPLRITDSFKEGYVISRALLKLDNQNQNNAEIAAHSANKITLKFYIKVPEKVASNITNWPGCQMTKGSEEDRIYFCVSSTGIGGTLSHLIKVLNYSLLYDKQCLREYFPIARDIVFDQGSIHTNSSSPATSHSLVGLCKLEALSKAMQESCTRKSLVPYSEFAFDDPIGRGDYCAFDTLLSIANAALQARLRAIKRTTKAPQSYINDLCYFVNCMCILQQANSYVKEYPFSSLAQESYIKETLLDSLGKEVLDAQDPYGLFDACLTLTESFLQEGAYLKAEAYLSKISPALDQLSDDGISWYQNFNSTTSGESHSLTFSGTIIIRYEICKASLHYLKSEPEEAWRCLDRAERHLTVRLAKYSLIDEIAQATFHPHYNLSSKIYFLRAKLMLFFPCLIPIRNQNDPCSLPTDSGLTSLNKASDRSRNSIHTARLFLTEKARLYAACDGDSELYTCLTAYQASNYLLASLTDLPVIRMSNSDFELTSEDAKKWAKSLRDEALSAYSEVGKRCYYKIKEKSGVDKSLHPKFGKCELTPIPLIQEISLKKSDLQENLYPGIQSFTLSESSNGSGGKDVLRLDMAILALDESLISDSASDRGEPIYLFGSSACYLFFIRGLYYLCSNSREEFKSNESVKNTHDWDIKFNHAYRLFSYAWAIAADGGQVYISESGEIQIIRSFEAPSEIPFEQDVASVRDLYPHRVADIAALGRLFAAVCSVLRLHTTNESEEREKCQAQATWLLNDLYGSENPSYPDTTKIFNGQKQFNAHLNSFLNPAREKLESKIKKAKYISSSRSIANRRDHLLKTIVSSPLP